ncbi:hypothetical protein EIM50_21345 [Pseudoxanthomonas sp. SGD-10]|nr:hypothetical protein EIM50_21345 [Pseudoxanthomonas sp. SGD-10]
MLLGIGLNEGDMKHSVHTYEKLYQELGKIFYAVSVCDNCIRKEEINALKKIIREKWVDFEDTLDQFNTDTAFLIETVFDWLIDQKWDAKNALSSFEKFKKEHESLFNRELKALILTTVNRIAESFASKNKSELIFISKLQQILFTK